MNIVGHINDLWDHYIKLKPSSHKYFNYWKWTFQMDKIQDCSGPWCVDYIKISWKRLFVNLEGQDMFLLIMVVSGHGSSYNCVIIMVTHSQSKEPL